MNKTGNFQAVFGFPLKIELLLFRQIALLFVAFLFGASIVQSAGTELTQAKAIARARAILRSNMSACQINKIRSISAARVKAGWRVTAQITMSASGKRVSETAVWIVSERNGASAQNQLTSEIANGCP